jgi:hypothetical protein
MAALCVAAVLATTAAGTSASTAAGAVHRPAVAFDEAEFSVPYYGRLWNANQWSQPDTPEAATTAGAHYFGEVAVVERGDSALDLSLAVEDQTGPAYQSCHADLGCQDVTVRVTSGGLLYLHVARDTADTRYWLTHLGDFPRRAVEVSATDADSGLKVYREVAVGPPDAAAGCEDYGDAPEAFTCLFLRELLPAGQAADADEATLRAKLPGLVQDSANYRLVFAEEFDGTPPTADANGCRDGLSTLDAEVWNYADACENLDSKNEACSNVVGGAYVMGAAGTCGSKVIGPFGFAGLNTYSNLHMKYGYVEFKYTFNADLWRNKYHNFNLILYTHGQKLRYLRDRFGVEVNDWEDLLKHTEVEIDLLESPGWREVSHAYANWDHYDKGLAPIRTGKWAVYCGTYWQAPVLYLNRGRSCQPDETFTVTRGIEWTPRGYRTFVKVDGLHDDLTVVPKDGIVVQRQVNGGPTRSVSGARKDRWFEYLVPGDTDSLLEQAAVGHVPVPIVLSGWGYLNAEQPYIRSRINFDYVRVWKPENNYTDMEPAYQ